MLVQDLLIAHDLLYILLRENTVISFPFLITAVDKALDRLRSIPVVSDEDDPAYPAAAISELFNFSASDARMGQLVYNSMSYEIMTLKNAANLTNAGAPSANSRAPRHTVPPATAPAVAAATTGRAHARAPATAAAAATRPHISTMPPFAVRAPGESVCFHWAAQKGHCWDPANTTGNPCVQRTPNPHAYPAASTASERSEFAKWCKLYVR